jgi:hypothetical protein
MTLTAPGFTFEFDTQLSQLPSPYNNHGSPNISRHRNSAPIDAIPGSVTPGVSPQRPHANQTMQLAISTPNFRIRMCLDPNALDSPMPHSNFPPPDAALSISHPVTPVHRPSNPSRSLSTPVSPTSSSGGNKIQCSGIVMTARVWRRCSRWVKSSLTSLDTSPDAGDERFCFQHGNNRWADCNWIDFSGL